MNLTNKQYDTIKLIGLIAVPVIVFLSESHGDPRRPGCPDRVRCDDPEIDL